MSPTSERDKQGRWDNNRQYVQCVELIDDDIINDIMRNVSIVCRTNHFKLFADTIAEFWY